MSIQSLATKLMQYNIRSIGTSVTLLKAEDRKAMLRSMPAMDEGVQGASTVDIDNIISK